MALNYTQILNQNGIVYKGKIYNNVSVSTVPTPGTDDWEVWLQALLQYRIAQTPLARTTSYYIASDGTGSDSNPGTIALPFATLAKVQTLINALPLNGDTAFYFKRGNVWRETAGLVTGLRNNCTIASYGTGPKPIFSGFNLQYAANNGSWSLSAGKTKTYQRAEATGTISAFREQNDITYPYQYMSSIAAVEATAGSWWWSANVLYVHPRGNTSPLTDNRPYEAAPDNYTRGPGVGIGLTTGLAGTQTDGWHTRDIRCDGWGLRVSDPLNAQTYCIGNYSNDNGGLSPNHNLFINCEGYYSGSHTLAHYSGATGTTGGHSTWINCEAGLAQRTTTTVPTIFNTFTNAGGFETIWYDCTAVYGSTPSDNWYNATTKPCDGQSFFGHTGAATYNARMILTVCYRCKVKNNPYGCSDGARFTSQASPVKAISAISWVGNVTTVTCTNHGYSTGDKIMIRGVTGSIVSDGYNGYFSITKVDANTFTYALTTNPGTSSNSANWSAAKPTIADVRCFIAYETIEGGVGRGLSHPLARIDEFKWGGYYELNPQVSGTFALWSDGGLFDSALGGWLVNSIIKLDCSFYSASRFGLWNAGGNPQDGYYHTQIQNCHFEFSNVSANNAVLDWRRGFTTSSSQFVLFQNCIFSKKSGVGTVGFFINSSSNLLNNAYYNCVQAGTSGFNADTYAIVVDNAGIPILGMAPDPTSLLYRTGAALTNVTLDFNKDTRPAYPSIGPLEYNPNLLSNTGLNY